MLKDKNNKVIRCPNCNRPISMDSDYYTDHKTGELFHEVCFVPYLKKQGMNDGEIKASLEEAYGIDYENSDEGPHYCSKCGCLIHDNDENAVHQIIGFGTIGKDEDEKEIDNGWLCRKCHEKSDREMFGYYHE